MTHLDYTWEVREKLIRKEEYADGKADGIIEGKIEGRIEGKIEGKIEAKAESIFELLDELGEIPEDIRIRILEEKDLQVLSKWHKAAAKSDSIEEFREKM